MIAEIQVLPEPPGTEAAPFAAIDAAIAVLAASGLPCEVGPLGTTVQGPADRVWPVLRAAHEACLRSGAERVATVIKLYEAPDEPTMAELVAPHRP